LAFGIECDLRRTKVKFCIRNLLVLIEIAHRRTQLAGLRACLLRRLLGLTGLCRSRHCLLIRLVRSTLCLVNTCLGATVDILDVVCILRRQLIQLIQAVFNRR